MSVPKRAIVSLANERGNYYKSLARLGDSLKGKTDADFFGFMGEHTVSAPKHVDNNYAFKLFALQYVLGKGYTSVLWLDSSVVAVRDVAPIFEIIEEQGYIMQEAGQYVRDWCNENARYGMDVTEDELQHMTCYGNAGMLGLDVRKGIAREFFNKWLQAMRDGYFNGSWLDHRHDLTCGSIIASRLGMVYQSGDTILDYAAPEATPKNNTIIFHAQGL